MLCDLRCNIPCATVLSLSLVLHAWPHDTEPYHSSGKSSAALGRELCNKTVVDYCLLPCCATQHDSTTLVSGSSAFRVP